MMEMTLKSDPKSIIASIAPTLAEASGDDRDRMDQVFI